MHVGGVVAAPRTLVYDVGEGRAGTPEPDLAPLPYSAPTPAVLEESFLGMPSSARPVAAWALLLVVASAAAAPAWAGWAVPRLQAWLAAQGNGRISSVARSLRKPRAA